MESDKTDCSKTSSLITMAPEIRAMCLFLCSERKLFNVTEISVHDQRAYENYIFELNVAKNTVLRKLNCFKLLWILRGELGDGLNFNPYVSHNSMNKKAKAIGKQNGHTPIIMPNELFNMINTSLLTCTP